MFATVRPRAGYGQTFLHERASEKMRLAQVLVTPNRHAQPSRSESVDSNAVARGRAEVTGADHRDLRWPREYIADRAGEVRSLVTASQNTFEATKWLEAGMAPRVDGTGTVAAYLCRFYSSSELPGSSCGCVRDLGGISLILLTEDLGNLYLQVHQGLQ